MTPRHIPLLLGVHVSIAGGIHKAVARGEEIGCTAIQVFTRNASRWQAKPLNDQDVKDFRHAVEHSSLRYIAAHDSYLINLASPDPELRHKSIRAFIDEMQRCHTLGIRDLVMHPGAHMGAGRVAGIANVVESFRTIFSEAPDTVRVLIENTAGQGTSLGASFEEISTVFEQIPTANLAVCFDTCHAFAAGYDLRTELSYTDVMTRFDQLIGLEKLALFHLNDSKKALNSRVDRHDHVGKGMIGEAGFQLLMTDQRLHGVPKILETPGGEHHCHDLENLALLRRLAE